MFSAGQSDQYQQECGSLSITFSAANKAVQTGDVQLKKTTLRPSMRTIRSSATRAAFEELGIPVEQARNLGEDTGAVLVALRDATAWVIEWVPVEAGLRAKDKQTRELFDRVQKDFLANVEAIGSPITVWREHGQEQAAAIATLWRSAERLVIAQHLHGGESDMRVTLNRARLVCDKDYNPHNCKGAAQPYRNIHQACGHRW